MKTLDEIKTYKGGENSSGGIGFLGLLTNIFITLKLIGEQFHTVVADWSWWWVLSPLWVPFAIILLGFVVVGIFALVSIVIAVILGK
jgi:hypothetical protein